MAFASLMIFASSLLNKGSVGFCIAAKTKASRRAVNSSALNFRQSIFEIFHWKETSQNIENKQVKKQLSVPRAPSRSKARHKANFSELPALQDCHHLSQVKTLDDGTDDGMWIYFLWLKFGMIVLDYQNHFLTTFAVDCPTWGEVIDCTHC